MTYEQMLFKAKEFMCETRGRPINLEGEAQERWYQDLGLIAHFLAVAYRIPLPDVAHPDRKTPAGADSDAD